jgi:hypothetical protein
MSNPSLRTPTDVRKIELIELAYREGIDLPMTPDEIIAIEDAGGIVDLRTGEVLHDASEWLIVPTVIGEATAVVLAAEEGGLV